MTSSSPKPFQMVLLQASASVLAVVGLLVTWEYAKSQLKRSVRRERKRHAKLLDVHDPVDSEEDESSDDDEDSRSRAESSVAGPLMLKLGPDGRPVTGLERDKLIVKEGRMGDAEINVYLSKHLEYLKERTKHHLGYPYNLAFSSDNLVPFLQYSVNNLGDPFVASNYGVHSRDFEIAVLDFFAEIYRIPRSEYWGYVTCSGTEGNLLGVLYAREKFMPKRDGVLYCSRDTHYSIPKAAAMYRMDLEFVESDETGEMIYTDLEKKISKHLDRPIIINVNAGTTVKGASDTIDEVIAVLKKLNVPREKFYIHVDGALSGVILPFVSSRCENKRISFDKPIDSVSVSGHKMLGTPMPSGIVITRSEHSKRWATDVEYLNSTDTTIMGSRNGQAAIAMWVALQRKGIDGLRTDVVQCIDNAKYLKELLDASGIPAWLNEFSTTVTFERPDETVVQKWQLATRGDIAHVVVMPSVHKKKLRNFHQDVMDSRRRGRSDLPRDNRDTALFTGGS